ncbi:MAG: signal peptide peptidase SppA [Candidatus Zixiibacteriota bacterium]|nr:MAG: signal peptide peptidase SppA [candidate division Zixibacteria bacterium]
MFIIFIGIMRSSDGYLLDKYSLVGRVAIIDVKGVIEDSEDIVRQLDNYEDDKSIKALVLRIDSPGGGVAASQEVYDRILKFRDSGKIVIASMGAIAASGGYYIACAADTILANPGSLTGSIGVILSFPTFEKLMKTIGIEIEVFKAGELKDVGNLSREVTPEERRMMQAAINDTYDQFITVVAEARGLDLEEVRKIADGSIYTGRQAFELGLIDEFGTLDDAISLAGELTDLGDDPRTVKERIRRKPLLWEYAKSLLGMGEDVLSNRLWPYIEYRYSY